MANPDPENNYANFSREDLINLIESKTNMVKVFESEMQNTQEKVNQLIKEKKDLTALNLNLNNGFSVLEAFAAMIIGQESMKACRDEDNNYDLDLMKQK